MSALLKTFNSRKTLWVAKLLAGLRTLRAVLGTSLTAVGYTLGIQRAADDVVTDTRKVLNTATANHNNRVLLQVMTFARDVSGNFHLVGQLYTSNLTKRRVRLLRRHGFNRRADAALLRSGLIGGLLLLRIVAYLQSRCRRFVNDCLATLTDELVKSWHFISSFFQRYL